MTDAEKAALIEKSARAMWHSNPGAELWESIPREEELYDACMREAEAALDAVGFFSPAKVMTATTDLREAAAHLAATLRKMLNPPSALPTPQQLELWGAIDAVEELTASRPPA
jgi:hypothetical protein